MAEETGSGRVRRSGAEWERLVAEQAGSGLGQRAFCEQRGVSYGTFCGWRRRLREEGSGARFVEVALEGAPLARWEVELALGDGVVLRLRRR
jgi:putative transposase